MDWPIRQLIADVIRLTKYNYSAAGLPELLQQNKNYWVILVFTREWCR